MIHISNQIQGATSINKAATGFHTAAHSSNFHRLLQLFVHGEANACSGFFMLLVKRGSINRLAKWFARNSRYHRQYNQILAPCIH
uniref:Uncharacterized protein n=1 Tax=Arundo donax TaxID=35708 RepID=A0A0A9CVU3_ARUDO